MDPFPEDVKRFLDGHIESIDQLEILRVLGDDPAREWSAADLAAQLQADPKAVAADLTAMRGRGLLAAELKGAGLAARYAPATPALADLAGRLLELYKQRPVTMIKLVYARAKDPLRNLADAFRLRREGG